MSDDLPKRSVFQRGICVRCLEVSGICALEGITFSAVCCFALKSHAEKVNNARCGKQKDWLSGIFEK